ncbi:MAG: serine/threonine protein kinase, partial [Myxococcales bacterium]|nr:serine/threonine protein kinase [Myxococcales bacterium]
MERDRDREAELWIGATQLAATEEVPRDDSRLAPFGAGGVELRHFKELARAGLFGRPPALMRIGRFRVLERVGQGGMGVVYAAYDEQLDRKVAVKLLQQTEGSAGARKRLLREAQAMARLTHENVVAVYEVGEHDHEVFVAMEFIRGQSLDRWLATPRSWREIISVFARAGAGLRAAHDAGLIHRDFKPHNVMRSEDGEIKVLDFGLV